jgi:hypothetical protein
MSLPQAEARGAYVDADTPLAGLSAQSISNIRLVGDSRQRTAMSKSWICNVIEGAMTFGCGNALGEKINHAWTAIT